MVDPQEGLPYIRMLELAQAAEQAGFEALVRSDHWLSLMGDWNAPATDAWTTLAGLARETTRIRLGTMVSPVTFRLPIALAKVVATVDEMSGGRVDVDVGEGVGSGGGFGVWVGVGSGDGDGWVITLAAPTASG